MPPEKRRVNPLGPTGDTVRANIERLRTQKRMTFVELSEKLETLGRRIPVLGLRHIELGKRKVDVDELMALAVAFGVSPLTLLLPNADTGAVAITGTGNVDARTAWQWGQAWRPLKLSGNKAESQAQWALFQKDARPRLLRLPVGSREYLERAEGAGYPRLNSDGSVTIKQIGDNEDITIQPGQHLDDEGESS